MGVVVTYSAFRKCPLFMRHGWVLLLILSGVVHGLMNGDGDGDSKFRSSQMRMFASEATDVKTAIDDSNSNNAKASTSTERDLLDTILPYAIDESLAPTMSWSPTASPAPSLSPTETRAPSWSPTVAPTAPPTEVPSSAPTEAPTGTPTSSATAEETTSPTMMPATPSTSRQGRQQQLARALRWSLLIPLLSISCIIWAVRRKPECSDGKRYCVNLLLEDPVPDEIVFPKSNPDVELVPASTWETNETWERDGYDEDLAKIDISTEYVVFK
jgi:hypothetical protein